MSIPGYQDAYNNAARFSPWVVVRDLDREECAPALVARLLPEPAQFMCFRVAVRSIESWLLADAPNLARFLRVRRALVPGDPDALPNPKTAVVALAAKSTARAIRDDLIPRPGSGASVGPNYPGRLIEFARMHWDPNEAATHSPSLRKAMQRIHALAP